MAVPLSSPTGARRRLHLLLAAPLAAVTAGLLVVPAGAAPLATSTTGDRSDGLTTEPDLKVAVAESRTYRPTMPRGVTGEPQLFDDARPSGLSFAPADSPLLKAYLAESGGSGPSQTYVSGAGATGQTAAQFDPAQDLAWSLDCDADLETAKPYCDEPTGYYWVHGDIRHRKRAWVADPGNSPHPQAPQYEYSDDDENLGLVGARDVLVRVADGCGLHADGYTDADGHYSIMFPSWCGEKDGTVTVYSLSGEGPGEQVALGVHTGTEVPDSMGDLVDDPADYTVVAGEVGTFNPEADAKCGGAWFCVGGHVLDRDFESYEEGALKQQGKFARDGEVARALTIMSTTMTALDYYRALVDDERLPQINLVLTDQPLQPADDTAFYLPGQSHLIYTPPWLEWSPFAVVHETGHYFDGYVLVDGGLDNYGRWGEPMANVRAAIILGDSYRTPSNSGWAENMDVQGNWSEVEGEIVLPDLPLSNHAGGPSQGWVWRILWDLHDGVGAEPIAFGYGNFDQWDGGGGSASPLHHLINGVVMEYLPQNDGSVHPDYIDRGQPGPDLVDMLDGFVCLYGLSHLHLETMLDDMMGYDYDYAPHCNDIDDVAPRG